MISEGSYEDGSNNAENLTLHHRRKLYVTLDHKTKQNAFKAVQMKFLAMHITYQK